MPAHADRILGALRALLHAARSAGPDDLPAMASEAGSQLGADQSVLYLADYDQVLLVPLPWDADGTDPSRTGPVPVEGTLAGRSFADLVQHSAVTSTGSTLWTPVLDGAERIGVLQLRLAPHVELDEDLKAAAWDVSSLLAELVMTRSLYGDAIERARRRSGMTLAAELQWKVLPPLTFVSPRLAIAGGLAPTAEVAGDCFDYALNGSTAHVAIMDAVGHGLEAALVSALATSALRNARRGGTPLAETVRAIDAAIASQFGPENQFVTAIVGELDVATGWWRWANCGHPPALLVRGGRVVKTLASVAAAPLGLGMLSEQLLIGQERLEPGDRLLLYSDGVTEARDEAGEFFGIDRLVDFVTRHATSGRPAAETLRRLNHAILRHQDGALQDDATTVLVEWLGDEVATRITP